MSGILKTNILKDYLETVSYNVIELVDLVKNQTISGIKTFSSSPIVPTPTTSTQVASKGYVDGLNITWVANDTRAKTALNASGTAPIYACRAWVNFNGTGTVEIRSSGNVSSITDNGTGNYQVNFILPMPDANYSVGGFCNFSTINYGGNVTANSEYAPSSSMVGIGTAQSTNATLVDFSYVNVSIFR